MYIQKWCDGYWVVNWNGDAISPFFKSIIAAEKWLNERYK